MPKLHHHSDTARLVIHSLPRGMKRVSTTKFEWDVSGRCVKPSLVTRTGRPAADWLQRLRLVTIAPRQKTTLHVDMLTPCRKCPPCIKARNSQWSARALHECREATHKGCRTWFCTFTLRPQSHYVMQCRAVAQASARSVPESEMHGDELIDRAAMQVEAELTKLMKRLRKELGSLSMRYLLVREKHKSGLPHWHALIHETDPDRPISYRQIHSQWEWGFVRLKVVEDGGKAARYVTKYLSKSNEARVRASVRYGRLVPKPDAQTTSVIGQSEGVPVIPF